MTFDPDEEGVGTSETLGESAFAFLSLPTLAGLVWGLPEHVSLWLESPPFCFCFFRLRHLVWFVSVTLVTGGGCASTDVVAAVVDVVTRVVHVVAIETTEVAMAAVVSSDCAAVCVLVERGAIVAESAEEVGDIAESAVVPSKFAESAVMVVDVAELAVTEDDVPVDTEVEQVVATESVAEPGVVTEHALVDLSTVAVGSANSAVGLLDLGWLTEPVVSPVDAVTVSMTSALAELAVTVVDFAESAVVTMDAFEKPAAPLDFDTCTSSVLAVTGLVVVVVTRLVEVEVTRLAEVVIAGLVGEVKSTTAAEVDASTSVDAVVNAESADVPVAAESTEVVVAESAYFAGGGGDS